MKLKELMRVLVTEEMRDVSVYTAEAELFGAREDDGEKIRKIFLRLAEEKKGRLKVVGRMSKEGTGFRQRKTETARSIEASLRSHAARAERGIQLYRDLLKLINKPESREAVAAIVSGERAVLAAIRELQLLIKRP
jgi:rubrerythrin